MVAIVDQYPDTGRLIRRYVRCSCRQVLFVYLIPPLAPEEERRLPRVPIEIICSDRRCRKAQTIYVPVAAASMVHS